MTDGDGDGATARCVEGLARERNALDDDAGGDAGGDAVVGGGGDDARVAFLSSGRARGDASEEARGGARSREVCDEARVGW